MPSDNRLPFGDKYYVAFFPHPSLPGRIYELRRTRDDQLLRRQVSCPCLADFHTAEAELAGLAVPFADVTYYGHAKALAKAREKGKFNSQRSRSAP